MQWPQFLAAAYSSRQARRVQSAVCYDGELTLPAFLHEDVHQVDPEEEEAEEEGSRRRTRRKRQRRTQREKSQRKTRSKSSSSGEQ